MRDDQETPRLSFAVEEHGARQRPVGKRQTGMRLTGASLQLQAGIAGVERQNGQGNTSALLRECLRPCPRVFREPQPQRVVMRSQEVEPAFDRAGRDEGARLEQYRLVPPVRVL